jgi:subtilisin-like proprotein convertase family protein
MNSNTTPRSRKGLWLSLTTLTTVGLMGALIAVPFQTAKQAVVTNDDLSRVTRSHKAGFENYDIRSASDKEASRLIEQFRAASGKDSLAVEDIREDFIAGEQSLRGRVPTLKVEYNEDIRTPEVIAPDAGKGFNTLTGSSSDKRSEILRNFAKANNSLIGMEDAQLDQLKVLADYANPEGGLSFAHLEQQINGIPVFRGEIKAGFTKDGQILRVINNLAPGLDYSSVSTEFHSPADAVRAAFRNVTREMTSEDLAANAAESSDLKVKFGTGDSATTAEKMYFPTEPGVVRPAWRVLIWEAVAAYYVIVDAETGTMLWRKNIGEDQTQSATYNVYTNPNAFINAADSPAPLSPGPVNPTLGTQGALLTRTNVTRIGNEAPYTFNNNGWITDGANSTDGNAVEAGVDRVAPDGVDAPQTGSPNRVFTTSAPAWNPPPGNPAPGDDPLSAQAQRGAVIQMFYVMNWYHDEMYRLGWTEQAFNFQTDNFGRGGVGNDRLRAEGQDSSGTDNANMNTPADGTRPRMQMYLWSGPTPDYDGTADGDVLIHEVTHGLSNRLHGNTAGLTANMSRGMGEGWSDFYAHAMLSEPTDPANGIYSLGGYATYLVTGGFTANYYYGIRRFPKALIAFTGPNGKPHNPLTFRHINSNCNTEIGTPTTIGTISAYPRGPIGVTQCDQVHNIGEVWSSALWEVRALYIARLGWATGNRRVLQHVTDGMKLAPLNPTLLQERDAILSAAGASSGADRADVWEGFRRRGMGFSATITTASPAVVTEAFDSPNAIVAATGFSVADPAPGGDGDGFPEPTETVRLTIPVTNTTGSTINNVSVQVTNGGTANYGNIADGQTVSQVINYTVPANAQCGSLHEVSIVVSSAIGNQQPVTRSFRLGAPVGGAPASFENTAAITINDNAPANPYPSNITVSGLSGNKTIKVQLSGLSHTFPDDIEILLEGPNGQSLKILSDAGGSGDVTGINVTLTDAANATIADGGPLTAGEFKPTDISETTADTFPAPAPTTGINNPAPTGSATFASTFGTNGANLNGTWKLYVRDDVGTDIGSISGGWKITFEANDYNCQVGGSVAPTNSRADFDGDGRTDVSVFRNGAWFVQRSSQGFVGLTWGSAGDQIVPGDYDGDNRTDFAIYRPTNTAGVADFYIINSQTSTFAGVEWGGAGDVAKVGDFDNNNRDDYAVYRASANAWYVLSNPSGAFVQYNVGAAGDVPVQLDYDGDGRTDPAAWNSSTGTWTIRQSSTSTTVTVQWGAAGDKLVPADYVGNDNRDEIAVFRNGAWFIRQTNGALLTINYGQAGDVAVPGDYDGDGTDDAGVFRAGSWFTRNSSNGATQSTTFGASTDVTVPSGYTAN